MDRDLDTRSPSSDDYSLGDNRAFVEAIKKYEYWRMSLKVARRSCIVVGVSISLVICYNWTL